MKPFRRNTRRGAFGLIKFLCLIIVLGIVVWAVWIFAPHIFRVQGVQTPVSATLRDSAVGLGKVLQIRNVSEKTLEDVVVTAFDPKLNDQTRYKIDRLGPRETKNLGWREEWNWELKPGERIQVDAKGYLPIVFSAKQLGIE